MTNMQFLNVDVDTYLQIAATAMLVMHLNTQTIMTQRITKYVSRQIHNTIKLCLAAPFGKVKNGFLGEQNNVSKMYYIEKEKWSCGYLNIREVYV